MRQSGRLLFLPALQTNWGIAPGAGNQQADLWGWNHILKLNLEGRKSSQENLSALTDGSNFLPC